MVYRPDIRRVVLVVLDGLRADAIPTFGLRCWQRLASLGASSLCGTTVAPSVTAAAMASLLTGAPPAVHGLRSDRFHLPRSQGYDPIRDIQVLCPMNVGSVGARSLNIELQRAINPPGAAFPA